MAKDELLNTQDVTRGLKEATEILEHERYNTIIIAPYQVLTVVLLYLNHLLCCPVSTDR